MKKLLLFLFAGAFSFQVSQAQTTLNQAVDFTATDIDGNTFNLFSKLNAGKYVMIDFFFTNCGPCQVTAPKLHEAFLNFGANGQHAEIFFVSINRDDNNAVFHTWEQTYMNATGPYPLGISGTQGSATAGPQSFSSTYGVGAYPTMILIAPNKDIVEKDIWPISTAADFNTFFANHGITPNPASINNLTATEASISLYPVPASNELNINANGEVMQSIRIMDLAGNVVFSENLAQAAMTKTIDLSNFAAGMYVTEISMADGSIRNNKFVKQ
jgi:thiol-disulfide isomerase/thioredoxin